MIEDKKYRVIIETVNMWSSKRIKKHLDSLGYSSYIEVGDYPNVHPKIQVSERSKRELF